MYSMDKKKAQITPAPAAAPMPQQISISPTNVSLTAPEEAQPEEQTDRRSQVREVISQLNQLVQALSRSLFQIELKEDQVKELSQKILQELTKTVGEITTERVKQIAGDFLVVEAFKKQGKKVYAVNSRVIFDVNEFVALPATIKAIRLKGNKPVYQLEIDNPYVAKYGFQKLISDISDEDLSEELTK